MVESLGNTLGLGAGEEEEEESVSLQEIIPARRINPIMYFMPKKYSFSCRQPKGTKGVVIKDERQIKNKTLRAARRQLLKFSNQFF
jgi:hypothetical protein